MTFNPGHLVETDQSVAARWSLAEGKCSRKPTVVFGITVFALGLAIVALAGLGSFPHIASGLFFSWDSAAYVANAREYIKDGNFFGLIASYTQSFGNLAYPINFNLIP